MTERDFCYWLQGFFELNDNVDAISHSQVEMIKEHLQLVFKKETGTSFIRTKLRECGFTDLTTSC